MTINYKILVRLYSTIVFIVIFNGEFSAQTLKCDVNVEYKQGFKIQTIEGGRLIYDNNSGMQIIGKLMRVIRSGEDSLISVRLMYVFKTDNSSETARGMLRTVNSMEKGSDVQFIFENLDGGETVQTLTISTVYEPNFDDQFATHEANVDIPNDAHRFFTRRKLLGIKTPYYTEDFRLKAAYPTIIMDYYRCFLKN